jgi:hypothetical protein
MNLSWGAGNEPQRFAAWRSGGFLAQKFNRRTALEPTTKLSYEALHPPLRQTAVGCWCSVVRVCKPMSLLSLNVIIFVISGCAFAYFLFSEGEGIFFNSILSAWERCKLFCKLCPVLGLVGLANVLTPVRWLIVVTLFIN